MQKKHPKPVLKQAHSSRDCPVRRQHLPASEAAHEQNDREIGFEFKAARQTLSLSSLRQATIGATAGCSCAKYKHCKTV
jgi:hypothetical protein